MELTGPDATARVDLAAGGRTYQLPIDAAPHAIHGTVYRRAWRVDDDGSIVTQQIVTRLGPDWPFPGRARQRFELAPEHAVCVEPQTGPPDGPNLAPHVVEPGSPLSVSMVVSWA